jgi:hypothetical protein
MNAYEVKVIKMLDFGAVVEYLEAPGNEVLPMYLGMGTYRKSLDVTCRIWAMFLIIPAPIPTYGHQLREELKALNK